MTSTMQAGSSSTAEKQFLHLKGVNINFTAPRPDFAIFIRVLVEGQKYESQVFAKGSSVAWSPKVYVSSAASISISCHRKQTLTKNIHKRKPYADVTIDVKSAGIEENSTRSFPDDPDRVLVELEFGQSIEYNKFLKLLGEGVSSALADKVIFLDKLGKISDFIEFVIEIGAAFSELTTVAKVVFGVTKVVFKKLKDQSEYHEAAVGLVEFVLDKLPITEIIPEKLQNELIREALQKMLEITEEAFKVLDDYANHPTFNKKPVEIKDLKTRLADASADLSEKLTSQTYVVAHEINERAQKDEERRMLEKLQPVHAARFSQGQTCLEETRTEVLEDVTTRLEERNPSTKLIWLHGFAGSGKSSIAATVRDSFETKRMLAGSFFCKRDVPEQRESGRILPSLSYTLAQLCKPYRDYIIRALEEEPDIASRPVNYQLKTLFLNPLSGLRQQNYSFERPVVFVVDALDECGTDDSTRSQLAHCLSQVAALADWLRVFVTSRPLPELEREFYSSPLHRCINLNDQDCEDDILKYTEFCLAKLPKLDRKWLKDDAIKALTRKASGLFIWTWTMTEFLRKRYDRNDVLEKIIAGQDADPTRSNLDHLYMTVISGSRGSDNMENRSFMKAVLGAIYITAKNRPLSIDGLCDLMPEGSTFPKAVLEDILDDLRSVLYEDGSKENAIRVCHPSFLDFLGSHERCGDYWTDPNEMDKKMIKKCLRLMKTMLHFNICELKSSSVANEKVHDLKKRIEDEIPESLQYACLYWITHCTEANRLTVKEPIEDFFGSLQVMYWLEVLSLIGGLRKGLEALEAVERIYGNELARDTYKLLSSSYDAISLSTPHLYVSALTWLPNESELKQLLYGRFSHQPLISSGRNKRWHPALWMNTMGDDVRQTIFSPDGRQIAACAEDGTICIWEVKTGLLAMKLTGPSDRILSISYSPDGRQLVSGSEDGAVRVWDMSTGTAVGAPLVGHTNVVTSVCYSPDGRHIASRSWDKIVKIWDSDSRSEISAVDGLSEYGHVVYSPDGCRLACCGLEGIIVRDLQSGDLIGELEIGRTLCLTYSPDGRFLASGRLGGIVRLFDAGTLNELALLKGHSGIFSVAFSPDSSQLLSASYDSTMIRWDVASKKMICTPLQAHGAAISSATYSPDGFYIASGSYDKTVRVWDVRSISEVELPKTEFKLAVACSPCGEEFAVAGQGGNICIRDVNTGAVLCTLEGHTSWVRAVAYSPSGKILASGSSDRTVRLWDTATGDELHRFEGHSAAILSIVFVPNGKYVISASADGTALRWQTDSSSDRGELLVNHASAVRTVCISPNGKILASGGDDATIRFLDLGNGCVTEQHCTSAGRIQSLAFSPNGRNIVSGSVDGLIQIWDLETYAEVRRLEGHSNWIVSLAFSFDGQLVLSSSVDYTVKLWDAQTGAELCTLNGHTGTVRSAVFTNDGRRIISASDDGTCRIWSSSFPQIGPSSVPEAYRDALSRPLSDGWIRTKTGGLVLWVSPEYRDAIRDMSEIRVPEDAPGHPARLDWSKLFKGDAWTSILKAGEP